MIMRNRLLSSLVFSLSLLLLISPAQAQAAGSQTPPGTYTSSEDESEELNQYASEDDYVIKDGYVAPTFNRLSKLYWALAMFDLGDNEAIDNYLMINECELYTKYYNNDFELLDLRAATRQSIVQNMASFDKKFEIIIPIGLDRYDIGTEKFKLDQDSVFVGVKRMEVNPNKEAKAICGRVTQAAGYPKNFVLSLSRPFLLTEIPMPPEVAQAYIEESQRITNQRKSNYRFHISQFGRVAYLRLKVTVMQFRDYYKEPNHAVLADLFGTIDGYEIYADRGKTLLLYKMEGKKTHMLTRRKKVEAESPETEAEEASENVDQDQQQPAVETNGQDSTTP